MDRFLIRDLVTATGGRLQNVDASEQHFDRVVTDSRQVEPKDLFWALKGEHHDGHDFVAEAQARHACLSVIASQRADSTPGPALVVKDPLSALGQFARWHRDQLDPLVIGITGSVGKTTTRELTYAVLSSQFRGIRSRKNFNNLIGLPLSLLDLDESHEFAVLEMGASQAGDIRQLCDLANPEVGIITAVGPAHLESFGTLSTIIQTKGELLDQLPTSGFAVLPGDDIIVRQMADRAPCPVIFVGEGDDNHLRATNVAVFPDRLQFRCEGAQFEIPVHGRHWLSNILLAVAVGLEIGIPARQIANRLAEFSPVPGRCSVLRIGPWTVIDDTYNASPLSVAASCRLLKEFESPGSRQRLLVLGDMKELGIAAPLEHERIGHLAAQLRLDRVLVCGEFASHVARGAIYGGLRSDQIVAAPNTETLLAVLDCWLEPDDILLVKGSRSTRMEQVIQWLTERAKLQDQSTWSRKFCA